ncbi:asparaginase [Pseudoruegeria sp. SHC-113]|uniref:asparaginase n=1 Tax=Pseudoruegeria sp. SHC-113 TaxID=2855439 RepID=UPI0021BAEB5A|nr:asparaginase [Pseudoruegeria sp. SHC-113]MCT8158792.1 asparaginase [Pseudoruegeria sp. SHC-113]
MADPVDMVELWRGPFLESVHRGHAVVCDGSGQILHAWGDPDQLIYPRSSCKMIQALPLIESGAAAAHGLRQEHLALACASHNGAAIHTDRVNAWLADLGMADANLRCGPQVPDDKDAKFALIRAHEEPCQVHNNCSGKHAGFLTFGKHMGWGPEYTEVDHPMQQEIRTTFSEVTGLETPGYGIDGCSAPNFATTVHGLACAMAFFATAQADGASAREKAAAALRDAMVAYPELVAGEGRACTELMRAMGGKVAIKTGAEAVFTAILPELGLGIALKIVDGTTRASECAIAAILVKLGVLDPEHPATRKRMNAIQYSRRGLEAGIIKPAVALA